MARFGHTVTHRLQRSSQSRQREASRAERVRSLAEELQLLTSARKGMQQCGAVVLALSGAMSLYVRAVAREVYDETMGPDGKLILTPKANLPDAAHAMKQLTKFAQIASRVALATDVILSRGAELRGPERTEDAVMMDPEEARQESIRLLGLLHEVDGDKVPLRDHLN